MPVYIDQNCKQNSGTRIRFLHVCVDLAYLLRLGPKENIGVSEIVRPCNSHGTLLLLVLCSAFVAFLWMLN